MLITHQLDEAAVAVVGEPRAMGLTTRRALRFRMR